MAEWREEEETGRVYCIVRSAEWREREKGKRKETFVVVNLLFTELKFIYEYTYRLVHLPEPYVIFCTYVTNHILQGFMFSNIRGKHKKANNGTCCYVHTVEIELK